MVRFLTRKIADNLYLLRLDDDQIRYFEGLWEVPEGITYNAYLLVHHDKYVLIDTWKHAYASEFIEVLKGVVDVRDIDYVVVQHMEPDHSGALPKLLEENGFKAEVLGHPIVKGMIESFYHISPKFRAVADGSEIPVGSEPLKFFYTPWVHWPDNIMTYAPSLGVLFSSDAFGSYSIPSTVFDDGGLSTTYVHYARKYLATVVGHYREHVLKAINKLGEAGIEIKVIAPAHGLVWRSNPKEIIEYYLKWARAEGVKGKVVAIYASMYGFVEKAMREVTEELSERGFKVVTYAFTDFQHSLLSEVIGDALDAQALVIGVSTYEAGAFPLIEYLAELLARKTASEKSVLIVTSYGWGGAAGKKLADVLTSAGFRVADVIEFRGYPTKDDVVKLREAASKLARELSLISD